ncbi:hypothetical protein EX30DRAFT_345431 [Ascodesmis nigricans]|uniref:Uncharacterized protein n=1 Tax=Ascodesmis nigricans TaxID=341454 RepID=A0A4V3SJP0_9PEZI|nr:hypothetical protein EX30DRAFT_345431 [Ascodesmis nigricans]
MSGGQVIQRQSHHYHKDIAIPAPEPPTKDSTICEPDHARESTGNPLQAKSRPNMISAEFAAFLRTYKSMEKCKWVVSPGCVVEERIYQCCCSHKTLFEDTLLRFFILDITDPLMCDLFVEEEEWVIRNTFPPLPLPERAIASLDDLRNVLYLKDPCRRVSFCDDMSSWVRLVHDCFHRRITSSYDEQLYHMNILFLIYDLFNSVPSLDATSPPIIASRAPTNQNNLSPRLDRIIQAVSLFKIENTAKLDIGAMEVSECFQSTSLGGSPELRLKLSDMLTRLHDVVRDDGDGSAECKLQTVGIVVTGPKIQIVRCWAKNKGGVILFKPSEVQEFPTNITEIVKLQDMLKHIVMATQVLKDVCKVLMERYSGERESRFVNDVVG